jgi:hypothetical protein
MPAKKIQFQTGDFDPVLFHRWQPYEAASKESCTDRRGTKRQAPIKRD